MIAACGGTTSSPPAAAPIQHVRITVGNVARTYRLYVPAGLPAGRAVPLVIVLHAALDTADQTAAITGFDDIASAHDAIAVYPQGIGGTWNAGICCGYAMNYQVDDMDFIRAVITRVEGTFRIDRTRVYAVGVSNGAILAYALACSMADRIVAIASVAGTMALNGCNPTEPVSVLEIHGTNDVLVPYQGGPLYPEPQETIPSSQALAARWGALDSCASGPAQVRQDPVTTESWSQCDAGSAVTLVTIEGGTHVWYAPGLGPTDGAVDATQLAASFLFQHARTNAQ